MSEVVLYKGDTGPTLQGEFRNVDITNFQKIELRFRRNGVDTTKSIVPASADGQITDGPAGEFEFNFLTSDTDQAGVFPARIRFILPSGTIVTYPAAAPPFYITVRDRGV